MKLDIGCLEKETIATIKETIPVLKEHGTKIATRFYEILFQQHPDLKSTFNMSNQRRVNEISSSPQAASLASFLLDFASRCENIDLLLNNIKNVAHKHVSFNVQPEQYPIVASCFLDAIKDVLGNAASFEVLSSWKKGILFLASVFIQIEKEIASNHESHLQGWIGYKELKVVGKTKESKNVTSFYFGCLDDKKIFDNFLPGQYVGIKIPKERIGQDYDIVRNFSLSSGPGQGYLRCSIKKSCDGDGVGDVYNGLVSHYMHDKVKVGDKVWLSMPCGTFILENTLDNTPLVLVSAGVGMTPIMSMLESLSSKFSETYQPTEKRQKLICIQVEKSPEEHAMKDRVNSMVKKGILESLHVFYTQDSSSAKTHLSHAKIHQGRPTHHKILDIVSEVKTDAMFYYCGPSGFMKGFENILDKLEVGVERRRSEKFGPDYPSKYDSEPK